MNPRPSFKAEFADSRRPLAVQVVRQYAPSRGGLEDVVANLSTELLKRGYRVRVVTLDRQFTALDRKLPEQETLKGVEVVRVPFRGSTRYPIAPGVFRHIGDADIVHVHAIDFFFDALAWGRFLHRKPLVATTHGGFFHTRNFGAIKKVWFQTMTRLSALAYRYLVGCSAQDTRAFQAIAGKRVVQIDNGVNIDKFAGAASPTSVRRIITLGRFSANKRLDSLLDTMQQLVRMQPDWRLDIVGIPGDVTEADLQRMIEARGLAHVVECHIGLPDSAIRTLLGRCSLFASASEYEGFGLVAVEAMSAGLMPLLQPNTAYSDLASKHGEVRLCDFAQPEKAAAIIQAAFVQLSAGADTYRMAAMQAAADYSWERVADRYVDLYGQVLKSSPMSDEQLMLRHKRI